MKFTRILFAALALSACQKTSDSQKHTTDKKLPKPAYSTSQAFNDYWYNNQAELNHYALKQARYGEIRKGDAVLIFVTEHMDPEKHVKSFNEDNTDIPVLKMNMVRKFLAGIYPYSIMSSIFTPVNLAENPFTLRETFSMQEWCGHVFTRMDFNGQGYEGEQHSYFTEEADQGLRVPAILLEDEIFTRLRIDPGSLPEGKTELIPSFQYLRFRHEPYEPQKAEASWTESDSTRTYSVHYTSIKRSLEVTVEKEFPYRILGFRETYQSGFGEKAHLMTSEARLTNTLLLDYWTRNDLRDTVYRDSLGLGIYP